MNTRLTTQLNNHQSSVLDLKPFAHIDTLIKHDHRPWRNGTLL